MTFSDLNNKNTLEKKQIIYSYIDDIKEASKTSDAIKHIRSIIKGKTSQSEAVISGISMIETITNSDIKIEYLIICIDEIYTKRAQIIAYEASQKASQVLSVSKSTFAMLKMKKNSNGLAAKINIPLKKIKDTKACGINIVLDSLELPGNIGTIIRTADGAGLSSVIITNSKVRLNNPTMIAACRAAFVNLDIIVDEVENIADWAKLNDIQIILADTKANNTHTQTGLKDDICIVVGCERYGIDKKWYEKEHKLLKIPMLGKCDSLNVGVAASILIYDALRQQNL